MKMFLTRLGANSKAVITGDVTQIDLPPGLTSGLVHVQKILSHIEAIRFVHFTERDVVRHQLVQEIINAYDAYEKAAQQELPLEEPDRQEELPLPSVAASPSEPASVQGPPAAEGSTPGSPAGRRPAEAPEETRAC